MSERLVTIGLAAWLAVALIWGHHGSPRTQESALSGGAEVIDGDTLRIGATRIRLAGIDAPETDQSCKDGAGAPYACGMLATDVLEEEIAGRPVTCFPQGVDKYGRTIASCTVKGHDLGDAMVRRGFAIAYLRYSSRYIEAENEAKAARRGIWAGSFTEPEAWRHRR